MTPKDWTFGIAKMCTWACRRNPLQLPIVGIFFATPKKVGRTYDPQKNGVVFVSLHNFLGWNNLRSNPFAFL